MLHSLKKVNCPGGNYFEVHSVHFHYVSATALTLGQLD